MPLDGNFAGAGIGNFAEALRKHAFQACAPQWLPRMPCKEQGCQIIAGQVQHRKLMHLPRVVAAMLERVILQWQSELVA